MTHPFPLALAALVLSAAGALAEAVALPTGFDGSYAAEGEACTGASLITVAEGTFLMMDGAVTVTDLIEFPGEPNRVEASLELSGGGGDWTDTAVITLAEDGQSLSFDYADGSRVVWNRCG
jgi:hypothetical protein